MRSMKRTAPPKKIAQHLISIKSLSDRWDCARSSVSRIIDRERMRKACLGDGRNGMVRIYMEDVEAYEKSTTIRGSL